MKKTIFFIMMTCFISWSYVSVQANYIYLDTTTVQRLEREYQNHQGNKELYVNNMITRLNGMIQRETSTSQKRVLIEIRSFYNAKKEQFVNVSKVVDELFGTTTVAEYTPKYNIPDIPTQKPSVVRQENNAAVIEFSWGAVNRATNYQIRFNNGTWTNNAGHTNHFRRVSCGTHVQAQVRACNNSGCSETLFLQATGNCYSSQLGNNYYQNSFPSNQISYTHFSQFKNKFYELYQKGIISNNEYNKAVRDLEYYTDFTRANQFYEGFLRNAYHQDLLNFYSEAKTRGVITESEYNTRVGNVYNRMYMYNSQIESIYNQEIQTAKTLFRLHALTAVDRLLHSGTVTSSYRTQILNRFDGIYNTNKSFLDMYDQLMRDINNYGNSYQTGSCSLQLAGVTYRLDSCSKSFSLRKGFGNQEFGFSVITTDNNRNYYIEVLPDVGGLPYASISGGFYSGYAQGNKYISKYFVDSNIARGNYSGYVKINIQDNFGNRGELRQYIQLNSY